MGNLKEKTQVSKFSLEGRFVGFVGDVEEKPKRLRIATASGEHYIKLSKALQSFLREELEPGDWIQISGKQKYKPKSGELKLKAETVRTTAPTVPPKQQEVFLPSVAESKPASKTKDCIMVCQKSSCQKRGAGAVCQAVAESLQQQGLEDQVAIKGTGCMKQCKKGPCVVFMPDKSRYTGVQSKDVPELVEKHFAAKLNLEQTKAEALPVS
ncbi:MAG: (2Fe-2S) ferredoxin domain-containing protein [Kastovskya adunca ATA6-11-RM4]|nr:(2Fe-2S) ferredoxin domain-containing protein [Kastovskya adunca ATA6-11-RM4]